MVFDILFSSARKSICGLCANFIAVFLFFSTLLTHILTDRSQKVCIKTNKVTYVIVLFHKQLMLSRVF